MKPLLLQRLEALETKYDALQAALSTFVFNITTLTESLSAKKNNEVLSVKVSTNTAYLIDPGTYTNVQIELKNGTVGTTCFVKNKHKTTAMTFKTVIDGKSNYPLPGLSTIKLLFADGKWWVV